MTTANQVKKLVKPLLARNPDLALVGRTILIKPVRHLLRGIVVDSTRSANIFAPHRAAIFLFEPKTTFSLSWGKTLYRHRSKELWDFDDPDMPAEFLEKMESEALPILRRIETLNDFVAYTRDRALSQNTIDQHPLSRVFIEIALGRFDLARKTCADQDDAQSREWFNLLAPDDYQLVMDVVRPLVVAEDRPALARLLHEWEAASVKALKLEAHWEPSPFPFEAME